MARAHYDIAPADLHVVDGGTIAGQAKRTVHWGWVSFLKPAGKSKTGKEVFQAEHADRVGFVVYTGEGPVNFALDLAQTIELHRQLGAMIAQEEFQTLHDKLAFQKAVKDD